MEAFCDMVKNLTGERLRALAEVADSQVMRRAFGYFEKKRDFPGYAGGGA